MAAAPLVEFWIQKVAPSAPPVAVYVKEATNPPMYKGCRKKAESVSLSPLKVSWRTLLVSVGVTEPAFKLQPVPAGENDGPGR